MGKALAACLRKRRDCSCGSKRKMRGGRILKADYEIIDLSTWNRGELFRFYIEKMRIVISLTVDVDVAPLLNYTKKNGMKFYPAMIWAVSSVINAHDEFRFGWDCDGNLIKWNFVSPSYAVFNEKDESFTKFVTEYCGNLREFYDKSMADREKHKERRSVLAEQSPNFFDVSCLPWVNYRHVDFHVFDEGKFLAPVVTWGKYEPDGEKVRMPLSMNIHHAVADGYHVSRFFNEVQERIHSFER